MAVAHWYNISAKVSSSFSSPQWESKRMKSLPDRLLSLISVKTFSPWLLTQFSINGELHDSKPDSFVPAGLLKLPNNVSGVSHEQAILILRFHDIKTLPRAGLIILNKLLECSNNAKSFQNENC